MAKITFHVEVHEEADGSYWAQVEELPGCFASGFSLQELQEALLEAMQMWLPEGINLGRPTWGPLEEDGPKSSKRSRGKVAGARKRRMLVCA